MRALGIAILLCAACAKKPAPQAPTAAPAQATEPKQDAPGGDSGAAPAGQPAPKGHGDPCSGGESKQHP